MNRAGMGRYPSLAKGSPYSLHRTNGGMLIARIGFLVAVSALALSLFGLFTGVAASPASGVAVDDLVTTVIGVAPGSPGWRDGIRPGDTVTEFRDSFQPGGWTLAVEGRGMSFSTSAVGHEAHLRSTLPWAVAGVAVVVLGLLLARRRSALGFALLPAGLGLAAWPLVLTGNPRDLVIGGVGSFLLAGAAVSVIARARDAGLLATWLPAALGAALALAWVAAAAVAPGAFDAIDTARLPVAAGLSAWGGWLAVDRQRLAARLVEPGGPGAFDLAYLPGILAILAGAVAFVGLHPLLAIAVFAVAVVAYPATRRATAASFERLVLGDVRRRAELRAIEEERGRLAREIHDAPLQELAAVIRRLETVPGAADEATALREVAARLRGVATTLHPPVLEDLGLAPALADLADGLAAANPGLAISCEVDDLSDDSARPDPDVELAAYRIVQEAAANAVRHSGGRAVTVSGSVASDAIELLVADDGAGIDRVAAAGARRRGHFGLDSMRERAEAVGGRLAMDSDASGVRVRFTWERGA